MRWIATTHWQLSARLDPPVRGPAGLAYCWHNTTEYTLKIPRTGYCSGYPLFGYKS